MAEFKCKMCGGSLEVQEGATTCTCDYCGTQQTIPTSKDEKIQTLFNRANTLRRKAEFDKAEEIYEKILQNREDEAEAYWGLILCKYGVEYVEDPATFQRVPTCHRASFESVMGDEDYKNAIRYADMTQKGIYEAEAAAIDEIQKGILELAQKEDPYDVFICYKETDAEGKRTPDSVIANEIYHQLTEEGYKVFYAAITLEEKLGREYEPYIFSAINTARIMLVVGTKPEYFSAVWVKNEWSRFLKIMKKDRGRLLIPCYRDMDPYDLPEEFAHLQAQDMSKLGFLQDLLRGIKKIIAKEETKTETKPEEKTVVVTSNPSIEPLLKRAFIFLEDGEWSRADDFCEQVLNQDPENAAAYLGKLMAELHVNQREALADLETSFDDNGNYKKILRYGDATIISEIKGYIGCIEDRKKSAIYYSAIDAMNTAHDVRSYTSAARLFESIAGYQDADDYAGKCKKILQKYENDDIYGASMKLMDSMIETNRGLKICYLHIVKRLSGIIEGLAPGEEANCSHGIEEIQEKIDFCEKKIEELNIKEEKECQEREKRARKAANIATALRVGAITKSGLTPSEKLAVTEESINKLENLLNDFDELREKAAGLKGETDKIIAQNKRLERERTQLGLFDGKGKKRIKEELELLASQLDDLTKRTKQLHDVMGDHESKADVEAALSEARSERTFLMELLENVRSSGDEGYGYEEAVKIYLEDASLASAVNGIFPMASFLQDILDKTGEVYFGRYEQGNGEPEPIEWLVLDRKGDKAFVVSKYALDGQNFHKSISPVTWETCTLRKWLNDDFLNKAFNQDEQKNIEVYSAELKDKIVLLDNGEVNKYFNTAAARQCQATQYCLSQGVSKGKDKKFFWLLRSPGLDHTHVTAISNTGIVSYVLVSMGTQSNNYNHYTSVMDCKGAIRPAMWIKVR